MRWTRWLIRLLDKQAPPGWENNEEERSVWLLKQFGDEGFRSYFKWRDYALLKTLGSGLNEREYLINVGRRLELLYLLGKSKEEFDREEKKKKHAYAKAKDREETSEA